MEELREKIGRELTGYASAALTHQSLRGKESRETTYKKLDEDRTNAEERILALVKEAVGEPPALTMVEMSRAITERRRILELNGHKPNTQDARYAVAQAAVDKIKKWLEL